MAQSLLAHSLRILAFILLAFFANVGVSQAQCLQTTIGSVDNIGASTARLSWSANRNTTRYVVQFKPLLANQWRSVETSDTMLFLSQLLPNTDYSVRIESICRVGGRSGFSRIQVFKTASADFCPIPFDLELTEVGNTSVSARWNSTIAFPSYRISYRKTSDNSWSRFIHTGTTAIRLAFLESSQSYEMYVESVCNDSTFSAPSNIVNFFTQSLPVICQAPTNVEVQSVGNQSATIRWASMNEAQSYRIQYRILGSNTPFTIIQTTGTSYNIDLLNRSSMYELQVQSVCNFGTSEFSAPIRFRTLSGSLVCSSPIDLRIKPSTNNAVSLEFTPISAATRYFIRYRELGGNWRPAFRSNFPIFLTNIVADNIYEVQVQSDCNGQVAEWSPLVNFTLEGGLNEPCTPISNLRVNNVNTTSVSLIWGSVPKLSRYLIQYRASNSLEWESTSSTASFVSINNLTPNTRYEFRVQSICLLENPAEFSSPVFATTLGINGSTCLLPQGFKVDTVFSQGAHLSWNSVEGGFRYQFSWRMVGSTDWNSLVSTTLSVALSNLAPRSQYEARVRTQCLDGSFSDWTPNLSFETTRPRTVTCLVPSRLRLLQSAGSTVTMSWTNVPNIERYELQYRSGEGNWESFLTIRNSATIQSLLPNFNYEFRVRTLCSGNQSSEWSSSLFVLLPPVFECVIPNGLQVEQITARSISLFWNDQSTAANYTIAYKRDNSGWISLPTAEPRARLIGLQPNSTYFVKIRTRCINGQSSLWSDSIRVNTPSERLSHNEMSSEHQLSIYPNPAKDNFQISFNAEVAEKLTFTLIDLLGRTVQINDLAIESGFNQLSFSTDAFAAGTYHCVITGERFGMRTAMVIIQN